MKVWLFQSCEEGDDQYGEVLSSLTGLTPVPIPTLTYKFTNQDTLKNALEKPDDHSGIIFTSERAVEAVAQIYSTLDVSCHHQWNGKKVFAIDEATSNAILKHLKLNSLGKEARIAKKLAPVISKEIPASDKSLLYPCGNLQSDKVPKLLGNQDRDIKVLVCYEYSEHPELKSTIQKWMTEEEVPEHMVMFRPSGVLFAVKVFRELELPLNDVRVIAIGSRTYEALLDERVGMFAVCSRTPEELLQVFKSPCHFPQWADPDTLEWLFRPRSKAAVTPDNAGTPDDVVSSDAAVIRDDSKE